MHNLLQKNKKYLKIVSIILLIGLIVGIFYYFSLSSNIKEDISNTLLNYKNFRYNAIVKDLVVMSFLLVTSIFIIGIPCGFFYLFYESLSIGFLLSIFTVNFKITGLIYILLYILINKIIVLILMLFFIKKIINISRYIIGIIIYRKDTLIKNKLLLNLNNCMYIIIFSLIVNILLYFISPYIFSKLAFLIK